MDYTTLVDDKRLDAFIRLIDVIDVNLRRVREDDRRQGHPLRRSAVDVSIRVSRHTGHPAPVFECHRPEEPCRCIPIGRL